jgi:hypothetical protein
MQVAAILLLVLLQLNTELFCRFVFVNIKITIHLLACRFEVAFRVPLDYFLLVWPRFCFLKSHAYYY